MVEGHSKKTASNQMTLLANSTGQKDRGLSLKKEKKEEKKKELKPDNVCYNCRGLGHWRNQPACPEYKE